MSGSADAWQSIATAPKDGTAILAWWVGEKPQPIIVRYVNQAVYIWASIGAQHGEFNEKYVTHWQPLPPEPPK